MLWHVIPNEMLKQYDAQKDRKWKPWVPKTLANQSYREVTNGPICHGPPIPPGVPLASS